MYQDVETFGGKWRQHDVKTCKITSKPHNQRPDIMHKSSYTPWCKTVPGVRRYFLAPVGFMEILVGYAGKDLSALVKSRKPFLAYNTRLGYPRFSLGIDYKNLTWVWGTDRKSRPWGYCLASRGFADWCKIVILSEGIVYPHQTLMFDSFSCIPFHFECFILKVAFITTHNDVDVGHF